MLKSIILDAGKKGLRLDIYVNGKVLWCDVFLLSEGSERKLGGNLYSKISNKLRGALVDKKLSIEGVLDGIPARLVVVLEGYNCIYLAYFDNGIVLYVADAKNKIIDKIYLPKEEIDEWNKRLCELMV